MARHLGIPEYFKCFYDGIFGWKSQLGNSFLYRFITSTYSSSESLTYWDSITLQASSGQRHPTLPTTECAAVAFNSIYDINKVTHGEGWEKKQVLVQNFWTEKGEKESIRNVESTVDLFSEDSFYTPKRGWGWGGWVEQGKGMGREKEGFPVKYTFTLWALGQMPVPYVHNTVLLANSSSRIQLQISTLYTISKHNIIKGKKTQSIYFKNRLNKICYSLLILCSNQQWISYVMIQNPKSKRYMEIKISLAFSCNHY